MNATNDYYQILQVSQDAKKADIISSYKRLCKMYHPDISTLPHAQEVMSQINIAYETLCDDQKRQDYNSSHYPHILSASEKTAAQAQAVMSEYFELLLRGMFEKAYLLLCASDRGYVSAQSFVQWRQAVQELYGIRGFNIRRGQLVTGFKAGKNRAVDAVKLFVDVLEKDHASGRLEHYCFSKYVVFEQGIPGVYLGYRDLNEISRQFDNRAREREKDLMNRHWQEYLHRHDRLTGLPTQAGLLEISKRELYRAQRYGAPVTVAALAINPRQKLSLPVEEQCREALAQMLKNTLRVTDIPAYLGQGIFIVLFYGLKKRHAAVVIGRLLKKAEQTVMEHTKAGAHTAFSFEIYSSGPLELYLQRLCEKLNSNTIL